MTLFRIVFAALVAGLLAACVGPSRQDDVSPITGQLSAEGYGPIRIGEPLPADIPLAPWSETADSYETSYCRYVGVNTEQGPLAVMVVQDVVARIDAGDEQIRLANGLGLHSLRSDIIAAYGDQAVSRRNFYDGAAGYVDYLVLLSPDAGVYFELLGNADVHAFRIGRVPELEAVEGCQ